MDFQYVNGGLMTTIDTFVQIITIISLLSDKLKVVLGVLCSSLTNDYDQSIAVFFFLPVWCYLLMTGIRNVRSMNRWSNIKRVRCGPLIKINLTSR